MEFIKAHFGNNERTVVKAYYADDEGNQIPYVISAEDGNPQWKKLLEHITIDELHNATHEYIKQSHEIFEQQVIDIAKRDGLIYDLNDIDSQLYEVLAKCLFKEYQHSKDKEKLFMFKLQLFELDFIKECTDNNLKRDLRKAANFIDATQIAINIKNSS